MTLTHTHTHIILFSVIFLLLQLYTADFLVEEKSISIARGGQFCLEPVSGKHYAVVSADICISEALSLDHCLSALAKVEVDLVNFSINSSSINYCNAWQQHEEDQISYWWPELNKRLLTDAEQHYLAELETSVQKNSTKAIGTADDPLALTPDFVVYTVKLLAEKSGNAKAALDFLQSICDGYNTNSSMVSNFAVLEWAFLSCRVDSTLCERSIYVLEILLSSKSVPPRLQFYTSWYLSGMWEAFAPDSGRSFQHLSAAIKIAAMTDGFNDISWQELHFELGTEAFPNWLDALPKVLPSSKLKWSTMHCSSEAVKDFFGDDFLTHLGAVGLSRPRKVMLIDDDGGTRVGIWIKGENQNFTTNDDKQGVIVFGATLFNFTDLPNFCLANRNQNPPVTPPFRSVDGKMNSSSQNLGNNNDASSFYRCLASLSISKLDAACNLSSEEILCHNPLLITGCGYSGTVFTSHLLQKWNLVDKDTQLPFRTVHENFYLPHDFLVCWHCRSDFWNFYGMRSTNGEVVFSDGPYWRFPYFNNPNPCLYDVVLHQVRHPLKFLSSALAEFMRLELYNGDALSNVLRWIESKTWPPVRFPNQLEMKAKGRPKILEFLMLHWISWNQMVEVIADHTFHIENANWVDLLCSKAGLALRSRLTVCNEERSSEAAKLRNVSQEVLKDTSSLNSHGGKMHMHVTWAELELIDPALAASTWKMAERYGYSREPYS